MKEGSAISDLVRFSINLAAPIATVLRSLASRKHLNTTDAVRRAINVWDFVETEQAKGNQLAVIFTRDGRRDIREVRL